MMLNMKLIKRRTRSNESTFGFVLVTAIYRGLWSISLRSWLRFSHVVNGLRFPCDRTPFLSPQAVTPLSGDLRRAIDGDTLTGGYACFVLSSVSPPIY